MNLHTPERHPRESRKQYAERREASRLAVERATKPHLFDSQGGRIDNSPGYGPDPSSGLFKRLWAWASRR